MKWEAGSAAARWGDPDGAAQDGERPTDLRALLADGPIVGSKDSPRRRLVEPVLADRDPDADSERTRTWQREHTLLAPQPDEAWLEATGASTSRTEIVSPTETLEPVTTVGIGSGTSVSTMVSLAEPLFRPQTLRVPALTVPPRPRAPRALRIAAVVLAMGAAMMLGVFIGTAESTQEFEPPAMATASANAVEAFGSGSRAGASPDPDAGARPGPAVETRPAPGTAAVPPADDGIEVLLVVPDEMPPPPPDRPRPRTRPPEDLDASLMSSPRRSMAQAMVKQGEQAVREGDRTAAIQHFVAATQVDPTYAPAAAKASATYFDQARFGFAVTYAERAVAAAPEEPRYRVALGDAYVRTGRVDRARSEYEQAERLGSDRARARLDRLAPARSDAPDHP